MRTILVWIGSATVALVVVLTAGLIYVVRTGSALDNEAQDYANRAVFAILARWDPQALFERATPELRASATPGQVASLFHQFNTFVPSTGSHKNCKGGTSIFAGFNGKTQTTGKYTCKEPGEQGSVTVSLALIKTDDGWKINSFYVTPYALPTQKQERI